MYFSNEFVLGGCGVEGGLMRKFAFLFSEAALFACSESENIADVNGDDIAQEGSSLSVGANLLNYFFDWDSWKPNKAYIDFYLPICCVKEYFFPCV